jgi:outer membrane protein OmpA-like peptidoglycan-associated protein
MSVPVSSRLRRYRRRILGWGSFGVVVLCGVGAPLFVRSVERDLEHRVPSELVDRGFEGVSAAFSGQDGVLRCATPLAEPEDAIDAAIGVWGVRAIELDRSCRVSRAPTEGTDVASTTTLGRATGATTPDTADDIANDTVTGSSTSPTSTTHADDPPGSTPAAPADRDPSVSATLAVGRVVLAGAVADETQRAVLFDSASGVVDPASIDDQLVIAPGAAIDDTTLGALAELVAAMPPNLVSGESGVDGTELYSRGVFVDGNARAAFEQVAAAVSAEVELVPRPRASGDDAAALEAELNEFVDANPILFARRGADVSPDAFTVLDQVAGIAERFAGLAITIEGHTDSDGVPAENQALSDRRAAAVVDGLVARGVPPAGLESVGLGATQPIVVDGVEDKDASRRVEFRVTTEAGA